jgi:hypothetical protein
LHVAADGPAQFLQALSERRDAGDRFRIIRGQVHEHANLTHPLWLLRAPRKRQSARPTQQPCDEFAPSKANAHLALPCYEEKIARPSL